jgi:DNA-binding response OmpR family regulator
MKIMVVDDQALIADCLAAIFTDAGFEAVTFSNPKVALAEFERDPAAWDVVVTDQMMPGMLGDELARRMRDQRPDLPIVLCTGNAEATREQCGVLAVDALLEKPYDIDAAVDTVSTVLRARGHAAER